ncbi:leucine zipper protein 1 [Osmerus eperlanus]|uniref:leucine zipper protein 1 n=1 Tax=Osmerus eperlanus TaxID=29151 RepID=UPI002E1280B1
MSEYKDTTNRHLRHKLQSLGRRLDELEEATNKLQKSEDELLDLQDKIIQAEGSNSALLGDVEALRKRLLKIEGKDEEVCKAEDLCRTVREKLEEEESLTQELKTEIERLQRRMAELEKLEEAFGKSKSDCSQLCLSLNEEKNLTKKLSSELEALKARMKEVDTSEAKLDRAEQALAGELEKLKSFTQAFVSERKRLLDKQREDEKLILKLTEKLERQKNRMSPADPGRTDVRELRIEDDISSGLTSKLGRKKSLDYMKLEDVGLRNKSENEKNSLEGQEDNKVKELTQEVERLKNRLKQLELLEEDLKNTESKNGELQDKFQQERNRTRALNEQVEQLRMQLNGSGDGSSSHGNGGPTGSPAKVLENGKAENEEINVRGGFRQDKPKYRSAAAAEPTTPKHKSRELSPQHKKEPKLRSKELAHSEDGSPKAARRALSPAHKSRRTPKTTAASAISAASDNGVKETGRGGEESSRGIAYSSVSSNSTDSKKASVLSRYPPAANDQKSWKSSQKPGELESKKSRVDKFSRLYVGSDSESNNSDVVPESSNKTNNSSPPEKDTSDPETQAQAQESLPATGLSKANGSFIAYRSHVSSLQTSDHGSEGHSSASETESTGSRPSEPEPAVEVSTPSSRTTPKYPKYTRLQQDSHSEGSSSRSSIDEELHKPILAEGGPQETRTPSGIEIHRVCSPREALRSKVVIKPAIVEIDRKEVMISSGGAEPLTTNGKPKISTKPVLASKMTSSITIYPNDPSSSRNSSRSSSVSSEPPTKERHTSTSNILIGPSSDHRGSISIPYEISIPKSEITMRPCQDGGDDPEAQRVLEAARVVETHLRSRSSFGLQSPETTSDFSNDMESGFESSSSTTTVTSWRTHAYGPGPGRGQALSHGSQDDSLPEMRNVTVRSTWRNRGAASVDEPGYRGIGGNGGTVRSEGGSEDEAESATTWRAYRATTILDTEETATTSAAGGTALASQRVAKPSPAEVYMRRISSGRDGPEVTRRSKSSPSSTDGGVLGRSAPHDPVSSQPWGRTQPVAAEERDPSPSPASWRRVPPGDPAYEPRASRADGASRGASSRGELLSSRGQAGRAEARTSAGTQHWSNRQLDN